MVAAASKHSLQPPLQRVISHGDFHGGNILLEPGTDDAHLMAIDFDTLRLSGLLAPSADLAYFTNSVSWNALHCANVPNFRLWAMHSLAAGYLRQFTSDGQSTSSQAVGSFVRTIALYAPMQRSCTFSGKSRISPWLERIIWDGSSGKSGRARCSCKALSDDGRTFRLDKLPSWAARSIWAACAR